jgi:hypothetical protein
MVTSCHRCRRASRLQSGPDVATKTGRRVVARVGRVGSTRAQGVTHVRYAPMGSQQTCFARKRTLRISTFLHEEELRGSSPLELHAACSLCTLLPGVQGVFSCREKGYLPRISSDVVLVLSIFLFSLAKKDAAAEKR